MTDKYKLKYVVAILSNNWLDINNIEVKDIL
jgi:hypothetical protein